MTNFMHIVAIGEREAIFFDPATTQSHHVYDLTEIVQFELDKKFHQFQPNDHYDVVWSAEF